MQYSSIDDIVNAYEEQEIPAFAVFHDKQLIAKYVDDDIGAGSDRLKNLLQRWKDAGSYAVYTIAFYEDLPGGKVKSSTPYDTSFNFQLNQNSNAPRMGSVDRGSSDYTDLAVENAILKMKLAAYEEAEDEEVKEDPLIGAIGKFMEIPGVEGLIGAIANRASDFIASVGKNSAGETAVMYDEHGNPIQMRRVSGIDTVTDENKRVNDAICSLSVGVPDIVDLLEKLALLQKRQPMKFKLFLAGLRGMKI